MQMRFEIVPAAVGAPDDQFVEDSLLLCLAQMLGHVLEVMQGFVIHAALRVAALISTKTVAAATARQRAEKSFALLQFVETQIKEAGFVAIHKRQPQMGLRAQQYGQRLQMEAAIDKELRAGQLRGQVELTPEILSTAGEDGLGARLISVQVFGQVENAIQVSPGAAILAVLLRLAQGVANQFPGQNRFLAVRFVLRSRRLKIEAQRTVFLVARLELCQLTDIFASDHHDSLQSAVVVLVRPRLLEQFALEAVGDGRGTAQVFARGRDGGVDLSRLAIRNGSNFVHREPFDGVENKGLAVGAAGAIQGKLHQRDQLV